MTKIEEYLVSIGYTQMRNSVPVTENDYHFSTMENGGCTYEYFKEGMAKIVFGLNEYRKPPTLCSPRMGIMFDDEMNKLLKDKSPEEIYKLIINYGSQKMAGQ